MIWDKSCVKRLILDMALKVQQKPFTGNQAYYDWEAADLKDDLGLDSIEVMSLAANVNSFFNLFEKDQPPYLLSSHKLDDWVAMVLSKDHLNLSFQTSGTSGQAKVIRHAISYIEREIAFLADLLGPVDQLIPYVPSYTIYGFLLTVALPQWLNIPVIYPSQLNWTTLSPNALIIGMPYTWQLWLESLPGLSVSCKGVSAAASLPFSLYQELQAKGVGLTEFYGSTETGGIGYRQAAKEPFYFFPYWIPLPDHRVKDRDSGATIALMDHITIVTNQTFCLNSRKDQQIKIAGLLVNLQEVAELIRQLPNVSDCIVSAKAIQGMPILLAEIDLQIDTETERLNLQEEIKCNLPAHLRPRLLYFKNGN